MPFFAYPPAVRKIVYTTNAIESLHMQLRKIVKNRGHFPSDEATTKLLFLALRNITKDWMMARGPRATTDLEGSSKSIRYFIRRTFHGLTQLRP